MPHDVIRQAVIQSTRFEGSLANVAALPAQVEIPRHALLICGGLSVAAVAILMHVAGLSLVASPDAIAIAVAGAAALWLVGWIVSRRWNGPPGATSAFVEYAGLLAFVLSWALLPVIRRLPQPTFLRR